MTQPPAPPWIKLVPADDAVVAEIERERDRGAALIAAALIDERLLQTIKLRLRPELSKEDKGVHSFLFNPGRSLSSHFARVQLGYLLQLYPYQVLQLMIIVNEIRNKFAHKTEPISFSSPDITNIVTRSSSRYLARLGWDVYSFRKPRTAFAIQLVRRLNCPTTAFRLRELGTHAKPFYRAVRSCSLCWLGRAMFMRTNAFLSSRKGHCTAYSLNTI
jgi:hypothetical protein